MLNKIFTIILFTAVVFAIILAITMDATAQDTYIFYDDGRVIKYDRSGEITTIQTMPGDRPYTIMPNTPCIINCGDPNPFNLDPTFDYPNILNQHRFRRPGVRLVNPNLD